MSTVIDRVVGVPLQTDPGPVEDVGDAVDPGIVGGALVVFVGAYLVARGLAFVLSAAAERSGARRITIKMFVPVVKLLIYGTALYVVVVPLLRLSSAQLLAVSGLLGAALGFGLRDLVAGVVGGIVLVTERPYTVGDKVSLDDHYGEVIDIGLRATTLRTPDDTAVAVPNDVLLTDSVANVNSGSPQMLVTVELAVAPGADREAAMDVVADAMATSAYVHVDDEHPMSVLLEDQVSYRVVRGRAYVADHRDEQAFASDVTRRSLAAFEERGIETPAVPVLHGMEHDPA